MLLSIFVIALGLTTLWYIDFDKFLKVLTFLVYLLLASLALGGTFKACDAELDYQDAKNAQWKYERENGLPYTSFSGE